MNNDDTKKKRLMSVKEFSRFCNIKESTTRKYIKNGIIGYIKIGRRGAIRIDPDIIKDYTFNPSDEPVKPDYEHDDDEDPKL